MCVRVCVLQRCSNDASCIGGQDWMAGFEAVRLSFFRPRLPQDPSGLGGISFADGLSFAEVGCQTEQ